MIRLVRQEDRFGCVIASLAMVLGRSYADVRADFGDISRGYCWDVWHAYLAAHGIAVQSFFHHDPVAKAQRPVWPLTPWSDLHLCEVDASGPGSHLVVLLRDGTVLDPAADQPKKLTDYRSVILMSALVAAPKPF